jgi:hypothetical protein
MSTIVISPYNVVNFPEGGGHFWVYMQYAQGLRQLGHDVYWLEAIHPRHARNRNGEVADFRARMRRFGFEGKVILYVGGAPEEKASLPEEYLDMERAEAEAVFARADLLLNFHYAIAPPLLAQFRRTALVDIDPGLLQFWISRHQLSVPHHNFYFTTGETVGAPSALFPDCGLEWIYSRPPVCLSHWPCTIDPGAEAFTTVSNWDADDWIVDAQETYENTKRVAFLEFIELARVTNQPLELALFLRTEKDTAERRTLESSGWRIRFSGEVANTPELYRTYIQRSRGEFSCAKRSCLKFQNAWISDRTLCYLASGKPAVVQNTGPSSYLPNDAGLFRFLTLHDAAAAFEKINGDYETHCRAARRIAETYFDSGPILKKVLERALNS